MDDKLILPKIRKIEEIMMKISSNNQTTSKSDLVSKKDKVPTVNAPIKIQGK